MSNFGRGFYAKFNGVKCCHYVHNDSLGVKFSLYAQRHDWSKILPFRHKGNICHFTPKSTWPTYLVLQLMWEIRISTTSRVRNPYQYYKSRENSVSYCNSHALQQAGTKAIKVSWKRWGTEYLLCSWTRLVYLSYFHKLNSSIHI